MTASWIALIVALWLAVVVLTLLVLGLSRRVRDLAYALGQTPATFGRQAGVTGPEVGTSIQLPPANSLSDASDQRVESRDRLVLFMSPSCGPCHALGDDLVAARAGGLKLNGATLMLITDGLGADFYDGINADEIVVQQTNEVSSQLGVNATPYGLALGESGVVRWSGVPNSRDDILAMIEALAPDVV